MVFTVAADKSEVRRVLEKMNYVRELSVEKSDEAGAVDVKIVFDEAGDCRDRVFQTFLENSISILNMTQDKMSLEDIFVKITREGEAGKDGGKKRRTGDDSNIQKRTRILFHGSDRLCNDSLYSWDFRSIYHNDLL